MKDGMVILIVGCTVINVACTALVYVALGIFQRLIGKYRDLSGRPDLDLGEGNLIVGHKDDFHTLENCVLGRHCQMHGGVEGSDGPSGP